MVIEYWLCWPSFGRRIWKIFKTIGHDINRMRIEELNNRVDGNHKSRGVNCKKYPYSIVRLIPISLKDVVFYFAYVVRFAGSYFVSCIFFVRIQSSA